MKQILKDLVGLAIIMLAVGVFYGRTLTSGAIPAPTDDLVGLYHPWRDAYAAAYPRGVPYRNFLITDPVRQQIPWRKLVVDSLRSGKLPGWDPTSMTGNSLMFNIQSGALYPGNIVFLLLPFQAAWTVLIISQTVGMAAFTYLYLRGRGIRSFPSIVGSLMAAFDGFSVAWLTWGTIVSTAMWIPLSLLVLDRMAGARRRQAPLGAALAAVYLMMLTAGHMQIAVYGVVLSVAYAVYRFRTARNPAGFAGLAVGGLLSLCAAAPFLSGYMAAVAGSVRGTAGAAWHEPGFFMPLQHLVQMLVPDFFGNPATLNYWGTWNYGELVGYAGAAGLLLAAIGAVSDWNGKRFFIGTALFCLLMMTDNPVARTPYFLGIPLLSSLQPTRLLSVWGIAMAVMAAHGIEELATGRTGFGKTIRVAAVYCAAYAAVVLAARFGVGGMDAAARAVAWRNVLLPASMAAGSALLAVAIAHGFFQKHRPWKVLLEIAVMAAVAVDLIRFGWKFTPFTPRDYFFPETAIITALKRQPLPVRVLALDDRIAAANTFSYYGIQTVGGYDPVYSKRLALFLSADHTGKVSEKEPAFSRILAPKDWKSPLYRYLNIGYILSLDPVDDPMLRRVMTEGSTLMYVNQNSLPRLYLADVVKPASSDREALTLMASAASEKPAVPSSPVDVSDAPVSDGERVANIAYTPGSITVRTKTDIARLLVFGESSDRNWTAYVDGNEMPIVRTNVLFMGVVVPAGEHTVTFEYNPFAGI